MRLVVADTSPLVYFILIDQIEILPQLFESVILSDAVHAELCHRLAPAPVRTWAETLPSWAEVKPSPKSPTMSSAHLGSANEQPLRSPFPFTQTLC